MPGISHQQVQHVLISRVDAIGDVVLTLPVCGYFRELFPNATVSFLGKTYTEPVINCCTAVEHFIDYDKLKLLPEKEQVNFIAAKKIDAIIHVFPNKQIATLAKRAGIKIRVGTTNRPYHWFTCNKLIKLSRKNSDLHESQLNLKLLEPFGLTTTPALANIADHYNFKPVVPLPADLQSALVADKFNLILHPKSNGSSAEWGLNKFTELITLLPKDKFNIIITGSDKEKELLKDWTVLQQENVVDMTGKMSLGELIAFTSKANGLVASSTGPLHLAAASGIYALGLYPSVRPVHPGRWAPLGKKAAYLKSGTASLDNISATEVYNHIKTWVA